MEERFSKRNSTIENRDGKQGEKVKNLLTKGE